MLRWHHVNFFLISQYKSSFQASPRQQNCCSSSFILVDWRNSGSLLCRLYGDSGYRQRTVLTHTNYWPPIQNFIQILMKSTSSFHILYNLGYAERGKRSRHTGYYIYQHTAQVLLLHITICFDRYSITKPCTLHSKGSGQEANQPIATIRVHLTMLTTIVVSCASSVSVGCIKIVASTCTHRHCCAMLCFGTVIASHSLRSICFLTVDTLKGVRELPEFSELLQWGTGSYHVRSGPGIVWHHWHCQE